MSFLKWAENNSKLQKTSGAGERVLGYGIPADFNFELAGQVLNTCPGALACRGVCYAKQGSYTWASVKAARYIEVTRPMAASSRSSSSRSAGATTAFSERNRKLRK